MPEWSNGPVSKSGVCHRTEGSNPSLSLKRKGSPLGALFVLMLNGMRTLGEGSINCARAQRKLCPSPHSFFHSTPKTTPQKRNKSLQKNNKSVGQGKGGCREGTVRPSQLRAGFPPAYFLKTFLPFKKKASISTFGRKSNKMDPKTSGL